MLLSMLRTLLEKKKRKGKDSNKEKASLNEVKTGPWFESQKSKNLISFFFSMHWATVGIPLGGYENSGVSVESE